MSLLPGVSHPGAGAAIAVCPGRKRGWVWWCDAGTGAGRAAALRGGGSLMGGAAWPPQQAGLGVAAVVGYRTPGVMLVALWLALAVPGAVPGGGQ